MSKWKWNESWQGFYHCDQPAYWQDSNTSEDGYTVFCSKCQEEMRDN
jgi:hypothetical protein